MDILNRILERITDLPEAFRLEYIWFGLAGLVLAAFVIALIAGAGGDVGRFAKAASNVVKNAAGGSVQDALEQLPDRVKRMLRRAAVLGTRPSEVMTKEACVINPYNQSVSPKLGSAVMLVTWISALLMILLGGLFSYYIFDAQSLLSAATILAFGCLLSLIASVLGRGKLKGACDKYDKLVDFLEGDFDEDIPMAAESAAQAEQAPPPPPKQAKSKKEDIVPPVMTPQWDAAPQNSDISYDGQPIVDDPIIPAPVIKAPPEEAPVIVPSFEDKSAEMRRAAEAQRIADEARRQEEEQEARRHAAEEQAKREAILARAQAEQAKAAAEKAAAEKAILEKAAAQKAAESQPQAAPKPAGGTAKPEDIIARIDKISKEGAPLTTMKEVALLLQQERAKPENKTPEQQRKLNEALAALLKAMSTATKK